MEQKEENTKETKVLDNNNNPMVFKQQIKNILEFFKSQKTRLTALELIFGLSANNDMVYHIRDTETCKLVIRQLEEGNMTNEEIHTCLHILINLSSHEFFIDHFLSLNATVRLAKLFLSKVDKEISIAPLSEDNMFSLDLEMGLLGETIDIPKGDNSSKPDYQVNKVINEYVINKQIKQSDLSKETLTTIPYILMIISNITTTEAGQKQFFCSDKKELEKVQGLLFLKMCEKYFENIYKEEMDFFSSIIANVSALKEGRIFILEQKIFEIILAQFDKMNNFKITNNLRMFRNVCFEFEKFEDELIAKEGYMINLVFKVLVKTHLDNSDKMDAPAIDKIHFTHFDSFKARQDIETIDDLIVDVFVVMTNTTKVFPLLVKKGLRNVWDKIETRIKGQNIEDRLFVISNFLSAH